ncbi:MAG: GNAT family N-acetyltransferase [Candidatus Hodarchaeota archaeon]
MTLRIIAHDDVALEPFKEAISHHIDLAKMLGLPYWVFIKNSTPVGIVTLGKEPVQLFAPIGTPLSIISIIDFEQPKAVLSEYALKALSISKEKAVTYAYTTFPAKYEELEEQFKKVGFEELANSYQMVYSLDKHVEHSSTLKFDRVPREEVNRFVDRAIECMSDSPDVVLSMVLENLRDVPDELLDIWYNLEEFYIVCSDRDIVGILDLNLKEEMINNIGVTPKHRGKGYGRQIMLFGLQKLKEEGCDKATLRVSIDNKRAIHLYKTLGFTIANQHLMLIWRK